MELRRSGLLLLLSGCLRGCLRGCLLSSLRTFGLLGCGSLLLGMLGCCRFLTGGVFAGSTLFGLSLLTGFGFLEGTFLGFAFAIGLFFLGAPSELGHCSILLHWCRCRSLFCLF